MATWIDHPKLTPLQAAIEAAEKAVETATGKLERAEQKYADAVAKVIGLRIGSVVVTKRRMRTVTDGKPVYRVTRYSVTSIAFSGARYPAPLSLKGRTINKDGSLGSEERYIYYDWTLEPRSKEATD